MIVKYAGYQSATAHNLYIDAYHYWDGPLWLYRIFYRVWIPSRSYVDFRFPVLYIRSPQDRIASNAAFEQTLKTRDDCLLRVWDDVNHWFPEQHSQRVLHEIRPFLI